MTSNQIIAMLSPFIFVVYVGAFIYTLSMFAFFIDRFIIKPKSIQTKGGITEQQFYDMQDLEWSDVQDAYLIAYFDGVTHVARLDEHDWEKFRSSKWCDFLPNAHVTVIKKRNV
jgi:hypothetical protein